MQNRQELRQKGMIGVEQRVAKGGKDHFGKGAGNKYRFQTQKYKLLLRH
jgi:hypothetical protein